MINFRKALRAAAVFVSVTVTQIAPTWAQTPAPASSGSGLKTNVVSTEELERLRGFEAKSKACDIDLGKVKKDLEQSTTAKGDLDKELEKRTAERDKCLKDKEDAAPAKTTQKPLKYACHGVPASGPHEDGKGGCACNDGYDAVVEHAKYVEYGPSKVCLPDHYVVQEAREITKDLRDRVCSPPNTLTPEQQAKEPAFCTEVWNLIIYKFPDLDTRVKEVEKAIDRLCPPIPGRPDAARWERCDYWDRLNRHEVGIGRVNVDTHVDAIVGMRGPGGAYFLPALSFGIGFYPTPTSRVALEAEASVGQMVSGTINGPITSMGFGFGPRIDLTQDRRWSLHLHLRDWQDFSDLEAGSLGGALHTQGVGNRLGGELLVRYEVNSYFDLRFGGFLGYGGVDTLPGGNHVNEAKAVQPYGLFGLGFHLPIAE